MLMEDKGGGGEGGPRMKCQYAFVIIPMAKFQGVSDEGATAIMDSVNTMTGAAQQSLCDVFAKLCRALRIEPSMMEAADQTACLKEMMEAVERGEYHVVRELRKDDK